MEQIVDIQFEGLLNEPTIIEVEKLFKVDANFRDALLEFAKQSLNFAEAFDNLSPYIMSRFPSYRCFMKNLTGIRLLVECHLPSVYSFDASLIRQYFRIDSRNIVDVNVRGQVEQARKNKPTINQHVATVVNHMTLFYRPGEKRAYEIETDLLSFRRRN